MENELCPERSGHCRQLLVGVGGRLHPWDALAKSVFVNLGRGPHGGVYASVSFLGGGGATSGRPGDGGQPRLCDQAPVRTLDTEARGSIPGWQYPVCVSHHCCEGSTLSWFPWGGGRWKPDPSRMLPCVPLPRLILLGIINHNLSRGAFSLDSVNAPSKVSNLRAVLGNLSSAPVGREGRLVDCSQVCRWLSQREQKRDKRTDLMGAPSEVPQRPHVSR